MSESSNSDIGYQIRIKRSSSWSEFNNNSLEDLSIKSHFVSLRSLQECNAKQPEELSCPANFMLSEPLNTLGEKVVREECCDGVCLESLTKTNEIHSCEYKNIAPHGSQIISDTFISNNILSKQALKKENVGGSGKGPDLNENYQSDSDETADIYGDSESDESDVVPGTRRRRRCRSDQESSDEISGYTGGMLDSDSEQEGSSYFSEPENSHLTPVDTMLTMTKHSECKATKEDNSDLNVIEADGDELQEQSTQVNDLDADQDKNNPAYVPRVGRFYMHDHRQTEETDEQSIAVKKKDVNRRWSHDKFRYYDQAPKSTREIVWKYGYDIRKENDDQRPTSDNGKNKIECKTNSSKLVSEPFKDTGRNKKEIPTNSRPPAIDYSQKKPTVEDRVHPSRNAGRFTIGRNQFSKSAYDHVHSTVPISYPNERSLGVRSCRPHKHGFDQSFTSTRAVCDDVNQKGFNTIRQHRGSNGVSYYGRQSHKNHGIPTDFVRNHQYSIDYSVNDKRSNRYQQNKAIAADIHQQQPVGSQHLPPCQKVMTDSNAGSHKDNIPPTGPKRYSTLRQNITAYNSSHKKVIPIEPSKSKENLSCKPSDTNNDSKLESASYSRLQSKNTPKQTTGEDSVQNTCITNFKNTSCSQNHHESLISTSSVSVQDTTTFTSLQQSVVYNSSVPLNYTSVNPHITTVYLPNQMHQNINYQTSTLLPSYVLSNMHQQPHIQDYFPSGMPNTNYVMSPSTTLCFNSSPDSNATHPHQPYIVPLEVNSVQPQWNSDRRPMMGRRPRKPLAVIDPRDPSGKKCDLLSTEFTRMSCKEKLNDGISSSLSQPLSDQTNC